MTKLPVFDYLPHCAPCLACCRDEHLFLSAEEQARFGEKLEGENCQHLGADGRCAIHDERPMECRLFPLDIKRLGGKLTWVSWQSCPAVAARATEHDEADLEGYERELQEPWVNDYVAHHEANEPVKYAAMQFSVIREVSLKGPKT